MYYVNYSASVLAVEPLPSAVNRIKIIRISNRLKIILKKIILWVYYTIQFVFNLFKHYKGMVIQPFTIPIKATLRL